MAKYCIAGIPFATKLQVERHVQAILRRTPVGTLLEGDDLAFMLALLKQHRHASQKLGVGAAGIRVDLNEHWKAWKMFTVVRVDGTETDFSYRACIYPPSRKQDFFDACRQAVVPDILKFKTDYFRDHADVMQRVRCPVTDQLIAWDEAHVDHDSPWPFRDIAEAFLGERAITVDDVELDGGEDGQFQHSFRDSAVATAFRQFHIERACLRVVSKEANLRIGRPRHIAGAAR